ncbi:TIGR01244 family sulfur transferase [Phenylobacterium sp.]|uniref:TIGR01244 family sulfur transferase n=1 Tax=Phenylobacterium sp. TaxID=1871053 RepID=UPI00272F7BB3|nr:TIGR01244 family sulfur transferase [Phenylobacterium sp.]MDP1615842.1 TIGR01244 family sulfur transferase [Phenylobacterium sp.]MDP1988617.1 TIGR01244 family sulfur transferase [Phenylobacterium sp.]
MTPFRQVTDQFSTSPQISEADVAEAAAQGFVLIINNRPDGEDPAQPPGAAIEAAAHAAGLDYVAIPVRGGPTHEQVAAVREAIDQADGPVLAYCRSGTRSIVTWALGQAQAGTMEPDQLVTLGAAAGYDLSGLVG